VRSGMLQPFRRSESYVMLIRQVIPIKGSLIAQVMCNQEQCAGCSAPGACQSQGCGGCHDHHGGHDEKDKMNELLETVKMAKEHLLKKKIMDKLDAKIGKKLDAIADVAVEMIMEKWKMKEAKMKKKEAWMDKLDAAMKG
jgi:hypothetical protein